MASCISPGTPAWGCGKLCKLVRQYFLLKGRASQPGMSVTIIPDMFNLEKNKTNKGRIKMSDIFVVFHVKLFILIWRHSDRFQGAQNVDRCVLLVLLDVSMGTSNTHNACFVCAVRLVCWRCCKMCPLFFDQIC